MGTFLKLPKTKSKTVQQIMFNGRTDNFGMKRKLYKLFGCLLDQIKYFLNNRNLNHKIILVLVKNSTFTFMVVLKFFIFENYALFCIFQFLYFHFMYLIVCIFENVNFCLRIWKLQCLETMELTQQTNYYLSYNFMLE